MFSENFSYYLNLVFSMFFMFFKTKKKKLGMKHVLHVFLILLVFENKKWFSKLGTKQALRKPYVELGFKVIAFKRVYKKKILGKLVSLALVSFFTLHMFDKLVFFLFSLFLKTENSFQKHEPNKS